MTLNDRLFAKKGEAAPAGIPVRDPAAKLGEGAASPLSFLIQRRRGDTGPEAASPAPGSPTAALSKPAPSPPTASALASPGPASAGLASPGPASAGLASPGPGAASPTKAAALPEPAARHLVEVPLPPVPARSEAANRSAPAGTLEGDDEPDWRRVSFRLGAESHRQLRNIARLWGVSIQGLLQKAVVNFLDAAVTGDDPRWRH